MSHMSKMLLELKQHIQQTYPFWNRTNVRDLHLHHSDCVSTNARDPAKGRVDFLQAQTRAARKAEHGMNCTLLHSACLCRTRCRQGLSEPPEDLP